MDQNTSSANARSANASAIPEPDPRYLKRIKRVIIILGVLLVVGMIALVAGLIFKSDKNKTKPPRVGFKLESVLPTGSTIISTTMNGDRLTVHTNSPTGNQIIIYNVRKGIETGRITLK